MGAMPSTTTRCSNVPPPVQALGQVAWSEGDYTTARATWKKGSVRPGAPRAALFAVWAKNEAHMHNHRTAQALLLEAQVGAPEWAAWDALAARDAWALGLLRPLRILNLKWQGHWANHLCLLLCLTAEHRPHARPVRASARLHGGPVRQALPVFHPGA